MLAGLSLKFFLSLAISTLLKLATVLLMALLGVPTGDIAINVAILRISIEVTLIAAAHCMLPLHDLPSA
jgi:hypothetical protein